MTFEKELPGLNNESISFSKPLCLSDQMMAGEFIEDIKKSIMKHCLDRQRVKEAIEKHFVCGYVQGLSGPVHSRNCRKCKLIKELGL